MIFITIIILLLICHTYFFYYLTLKLLTRKRRVLAIPSESIQNTPKVSIIISAYNEESIVENKINNLLSLNYPDGSLEILIGSDGSTDHTNQKLAQFKDQITFVPFPQNRGKAAVLNDLVQRAQGTILVFCDMNTLFFPTAIEELVRGFQNEDIGAINGKLLLLDSGKTILGEGESLYWRMETEIKSLEADLGYLMGLNGAIYAIRKEIFPLLPTDKKLTDDFYVCAKVLQKGYQCKYSPFAIGLETTSKEQMGEFKRKVRIGQANFNFLVEYLPLMNLKKPMLSYIFISHKIIRWFSPFLLILLFTCSLILQYQTPSLWNTTLLVIQIYGYSTSVLVHLHKFALRLPGAGIAYYFCTMNLALFIGSLQTIRKTKVKSGAWERIERDDA